MPSSKALLRPFANMRHSLSLRKSFLVHLLAATLCALVLSWGTLVVAANILQRIYDNSYGPTHCFIYNENKGTLMSAEPMDLNHNSGEDFLPVYLPLTAGIEVPVNDLRGSEYANFYIYGSTFSVDGLTRDIQDGGIAFSFLGGPYPPIVGGSAREAMDNYQDAMWELFVRRLAEAPNSEAARRYEQALGSLPKTADEARSLFQQTYGTPLATPFDFFSTSMYTEADVQARKTVLAVAYGLVAVWFALCFIVGGNRFYRSRLAKPLGLLENAADRIAQEDLDFTVAYKRSDEMGKLASSFEAMRASLEDTLQQLWQTAEDRRQLNAAFAHDLRTPLAVLRGRVEMLAEQAEAGNVSPDEAAATCERLLAQVQRLENYVTTMSSLQRLEDRSLRIEPIAGKKLADDLQELALSLRQNAELDIVITVECDYGTPEQAEDPLLNLDESLVLEVAENLIANAIRYASEHVEVAVSCPERPNNRNTNLLCVRVHDDGSGFSPDALSTGHNPFFSEAHGSKHLGVGLNIATTLCELHGGTLKLKNDEGGGALAIASFYMEKPQVDSTSFLRNANDE